MTFSGDEEEISSDSDRVDAQRPRRKSRSVKSKSKSDLQNTLLVSSDALGSAPLSTSGNTIIQRAGHISTASETSFHPTKTSTQLKDGQKQVKKKNEVVKQKSKQVSSKKPPSSIHMEFSDSESERDEALERLLAEDTERFQGLSQLTKSIMAGTSNKNKTTASVVGTGVGPSRGFAKKSTGNMADAKKSRKSVTFVTDGGSESESGREGRTRTTSKRPPAAIDDIYMSFDEVHVDVHVRSRYYVYYMKPLSLLMYYHCYPPSLCPSCGEQGFI